MSKHVSVGAIELSSIGAGYQVQDALMKAAATTLIMARTVCSGKYLIIYSGTVGDVEAAMDTARQVGGEFVVDYLTVANVHQALFPAMAQSVALGPAEIGALGVVETKTAVSSLIAADAAAKAANVTLFRLSLAMSIGGKGLLLLTGSLADVQASVDAASASIESRGTLLSAVVLPRPERELFNDYI